MTTSQSFQLLNWDHEVNPTSKVDLLENIRLEVSKFTGWKFLRVELDNGVLSIDVMDNNRENPQQLLKLEVSTWRPIYGRPQQVGFTLADMAVLQYAVRHL